MRAHPLTTLLVILLVTGVALFIALPDDWAYPPALATVKQATKLKQGLDLQGGIQVLLEARPPAGVTLVASDDADHPSAPRIREPA